MQIISPKTIKIIAVSFVLAAGATYIGFAFANNTQNIEYTLHEKEGRLQSCYNMPISGSPTIEIAADIINHGPGHMQVVRYAASDTTAGCNPTDSNSTLDAGLFVMSGKIDYAEGASGQAVFDYNTAQKNCGRVQVDAAFRNDAGEDQVPNFIGVVINYGVDCTTTPPTNNPPVGFLDLVNCDHIAGWAQDPDAPNAAVNIQIYKDGPAGIGTLVTTIPANQSRSDVGAHAFDIFTPSAFKDGGVHEVWVYAQDTTSGQFMLFTNRKIFDFGTCVANPVCTTGTVQVNSNRDDQAYYTTRPNGTTFGWRGTHTFPGESIGNYSVAPDDLAGFTKSVSPASGFLACNATLVFTIIYTPVAVCTTGTVTVNSNNQSAAYYVTRPNGTIFGWNGTHTFPNSPLGTYSVAPDDVPGYTKSVSPASGSLACNANLVFTINYTPVAACSTGTLQVNVNGKSDGAYFVTRPDGSTFGWNGTKTFNDYPNGAYSIVAGVASGYTTSVSPSSGSINCNTLTFTVTYTPVGATPVLTCSPANQSVQVNQTTSFTVSGGNGGYSWSAPVGNPSTGSGSSFSTQYAAAGSYTVTVSATGATSATCGVTVTSLPLNTLVCSPANQSAQVNQTASFSVTGGNGGYSWSAPSGSPSTGSGTSFVTAYSVAGSYVVSVSATGATSATCSVTVNALNQTATLVIVKTVRNVTQSQVAFVKSTSANPTDQVQFQIQVTNNGTGAAQNVNVTDQLPNFFFAGGATSFSLGNLAAGASQTVTLNASVAAETNFPVGSSSWTNTATATASNASTVSDTAVVNVNRTATGTPSLTITKTVRNLSSGQSTFTKSTSANPGEQVQFQIQVQVSNSNNTSAQNVVVTDLLPNYLTLSSGSTTFNLGTMTAGSSQTVTLNATISSSAPANSTVYNTAQVTSTNAGSGSDQAFVFINGTNIVNNNVNLSLTKEVSNLTTGTTYSSFANASSTDQIQFRLTVRNNYSSASANNVRLTDYLPTGLSYVPGTFQADGGTSYGTLIGGAQYLGSLNPGQSRVLTFQAQINSSGSQTLTNTASASADNATTVQASATVYISSVLGSNVNLVLSKKAFNQTQNVDATTTVARSADLIVYTLVVDNRGNAPANNFVFQDDLSDVLQLSMLQSFGDGQFYAGTLTLQWAPVTIPANGHVEKTFTVKVNNTFPAGSDYTMTNTFGNTINVRVPQVLGVFYSPKTGSTLTISLVLGFIAMLLAIAWKQKQFIAEKLSQYRNYV